MSEQLNWFVIPDNNSTNRIFPGAEAHYDLFNETNFQRVVHGEREYGINLVWDDPDPATPSVRFLPLSGSPSAITYGERVAIHIRGGGFIRYGEREYGINLKWSATPVYEWRLRGDSPPSDTPVDLALPVGLFNTVRGDYLFYDPRRYGINLKWLQDKGKHNSTPWYESIGNAITGFFSELGNVIFEILNRVFGVVDFVLTLLGIMLPKRIRIRLVILRDSKGCSVIAGPDEQQQINDAIAVIRKCCSEQINTTVRAADGVLIETLPHPAPAYALDVLCDSGALQEDYGEAGAYFRAHMAVNNSSYVLGYAAPITVFVVEEIEGKVGCSLGPLTDYVVVGKRGMRTTIGAPEPRPTTPMHEIGHSCGILPKHTAESTNLMKNEVPRGITLKRLQRALMRDSRHVTFL